jgi:hypothetical protein
MKRLLLIVLLAAPSMGVTCGPGGGPPPPDTCDTAGTTGITSIEIGAPASGAFQPYTDDQIVMYQTGGQGSTMLPVRLRFNGSNLPSCVPESAMVSYAGNPIASDANPVKTYAESDGTRTTKPIYLVIGFGAPPIGSQVIVSATVGSLTATRRLWIDQVGSIDAGLPAGPDAHE